MAHLASLSGRGSWRMESLMFFSFSFSSVVFTLISLIDFDKVHFGTGSDIEQQCHFEYKFLSEEKSPTNEGKRRAWVFPANIK